MEDEGVIRSTRVAGRVVRPRRKSVTRLLLLLSHLVEASLIVAVIVIVMVAKPQCGEEAQHGAEQHVLKSPPLVRVARLLVHRPFAGVHIFDSLLLVSILQLVPTTHRRVSYPKPPPVSTEFVSLTSSSPSDHR